MMPGQRAPRRRSGQKAGRPLTRTRLARAFMHAGSSRSTSEWHLWALMKQRMQAPGVVQDCNLSCPDALTRASSIRAGRPRARPLSRAASLRRRFKCPRTDRRRSVASNGCRSDRRRRLGRQRRKGKSQRVVEKEMQLQRVVEGRRAEGSEFAHQKHLCCSIAHALVSFFSRQEFIPFLPYRPKNLLIHMKHWTSWNWIFHDRAPEGG
mmetsp:Transcript_14899/g.40156  ORF Transcript_14899/g.40156 Transcript_14899/m.40156 type:complete len:208 (-) Transcript_14899:58-681(-)